MFCVGDQPCRHQNKEPPSSSSQGHGVVVELAGTRECGRDGPGQGPAEQAQHPQTLCAGLGIPRAPGLPFGLSPTPSAVISSG